MKFALSGRNTAAVSPATASSAVLLYGSAVTSGRVFWLRGIAVIPNATVGPLRVIDASSGSTATGSLLSIFFDPGSSDTQVLNIGEPGLRFGTGVAGFLDASGSIGIGGVSCWGYEEG